GPVDVEVDNIRHAARADAIQDVLAFLLERAVGLRGKVDQVLHPVDTQVGVPGELAGDASQDPIAGLNVRLQPALSLDQCFDAQALGRVGIGATIGNAPK